MRKLTLVEGFSLICFVAMVLFCFILGSVMTKTMERDQLDRAKKLTATIVAALIKDEFKPEEIAEPMVGDAYEKISKRIRHLYFGPDVIRLKIWNRESVVVWSDNPKIVGKAFPDNRDLMEALKGDVFSEIKEPKKTENALERNFGKLLELYVPIRFDGEKSVMIVVEAYQNLDPFYEYINNQKRNIWLMVTVGFSFLYLLLFGIVWRASRLIDVQTREIVISEEKYRGLVESAQDCIVSTDKDGLVVLFNKAAEAVWGYTNKDAMGRAFELLVAERHREALRIMIRSCAESFDKKLHEKTVEIEGQRKNGEIFPMDISMFSSGAGESLIITGIIRDISERKEMEMQLVMAERQASVSLIAGGIGHELKNVIQSLLGYAELLLLKPKDAELAQKCASMFSKECWRLNTHAINLLELSKPKKPQMVTLDINLLLNKVTDMLVTSGMLKLFTIEKKCHEEPLYVVGDEMLLDQVIRNLEINAAHAMENKGVLTVSSGISDDRIFAEFTIEDTGYGISEDKREEIFVPFYTTKEKGKGTGLGLYIVKQIVEQHKGYIRVSSNVGIGTIFTVGLPLK
ncbi:MAG: PAS domain S-box protein [Nitrospirae bacterium]|nr:PAS domain S-box protein [Nitrospirota bacterium]